LQFILRPGTALALWIDAGRQGIRPWTAEHGSSNPGRRPEDDRLENRLYAGGRGAGEWVNEMSDRLHELMAAEKDVLREALLTQLRNSTARRYREVNLLLLRERCETLVDRFLEAVESSPRRFVDYITGIARVRIEEGFHLDEIQMALNIFEEYAWKVCAHKVADKEQLLKDLSLVTGIFGTAKDQLALEYLRQKEDLLACVRPLIEKLEELSSYSEASPMVME
jgi:hypothetical protein